MIEIQAIKIERLEQEVSEQASTLHELEHSCKDYRMEQGQPKDNGEVNGNTDRKPSISYAKTNQHIRDSSNVIKKRAGIIVYETIVIYIYFCGRFIMIILKVQDNNLKQEIEALFKK